MDGGLVDNLEEVEEKDGALVDVVECNVVVDIGVFVCDVGFNSLGFVAVANSVSVLFCIVLFVVGVVVVVAVVVIFFFGSFVARLIGFTFSYKTFGSVQFESKECPTQSPNLK